jgi:hypothetical protein
MRELTPIEALRLLTGCFDPKNAINILVLVNLLARYLDNDPILEEEFLIMTFKNVGIKLILGDK